MAPELCGGAPAGAVDRYGLRALVRQAAGRLAAAGVTSPQVDARILAERAADAAAEAAQARRSQVRTVDRSERIRTYNFPENRIADHRTGFKAYNLDAVLDGDLGPVIASAIAMDEAERLSQVGEGSGS